MSSLIEYSQKDTGVLDGQTYSELDALIFAQLSYANFESLSEADKNELVADNSLSNFASILLNSPKVNKDSDLQKLLKNIAANPRYADCTVSNFKAKNTETEQWAGITIHLNDPENTVAVAYRGTDKTEVGWQEDFELAYSPATDAQKSSQNYLEEVAKANPNSTINISGHSKGGNDAIYAYIASDESVRNRVARVHNFDGPGVMGEVAEVYAQGYAELSDKLTSYCPKNSVIGMLLVDHGTIIFVDSTGQSNQVENMWILSEHDAYTWIIEDSGTFKECPQSELSNYINHILDGVLDSLTKEEREELIKLLDDLGVFAMIANSGVHPNSEMLMMILKLLNGETNISISAIRELFSEYSELTEAQKAVLIKVVSAATFRAFYNYEDIKNTVDAEIDKWVNEQIEKINEGFDKARITLKLLGFSDFEIQMAENISKLLMEGIRNVAKGFVEYLRDVIFKGSSKSYPMDVIFVNMRVIEDTISKLNDAQRRIKNVDHLLDDLRSCFKSYELIDKAMVAQVDFTMTSSSIAGNILEHLLYEGYDWELNKCINFLSTINSQLQQNERRLLANINLIK